AVSARQRTDEGRPESTWYVYDGKGVRVRKVTTRAADGGRSATGTRRQEQLYLDGVEFHREYDADGETIRLERRTLHVFDGDRRVAMIERRTAGDDDRPAQAIRFQYPNHLESPVLELDGEGRLLSYEEHF